VGARARFDQNQIEPFNLVLNQLKAIAMNYVVAVLPDRIQAETAYLALEQEKISPKQIDILGQGYKSADEFGFTNPNRQAIKQFQMMAVWLVPFGFVAGCGFSFLTGLETFAWAGVWGNHLIGGVLGAIGGAMGSFFVGGGVGLALGSGDALPYRNRLNAGQYLVVVRGSLGEIQRSAGILDQFALGKVQQYGS